jgi:hypothetical protein
VGGDFAEMVVQVNATSKKSNNNTFVVTATDSYNHVITQTLYLAPYVPPIVTRVKNTESTELSISPNPSNGKFTVSNMNASKLKVQNLLGATICDLNVSALGNTEIDLTSYPIGIYWVQFIQGNETITRKIIKN